MKYFILISLLLLAGCSNEPEWVNNFNRDYFEFCNTLTLNNFTYECMYEEYEADEGYFIECDFTKIKFEGWLYCSPESINYGRILNETESNLLLLPCLRSARSIENGTKACYEELPEIFKVINMGTRRMGE